MERWSDGVYLLGRYGSLATGCWLLAHGHNAAILEIPPYGRKEHSPAAAAEAAARQLAIHIDFLLCSHCHSDHLSERTLRELRKRFPQATPLFQAGFRPYMSHSSAAEYFDNSQCLTLGGEPLFLVHAPKHSWTDTMVIFRGAIFTGDWELNTIRSVHDGKGHDSVPHSRKLKSIDALTRFVSQQDYVIHKAFAVHANDRRENIDFLALMYDTKTDRVLW